jgi:hypothetical protein
MFKDNLKALIDKKEKNPRQYSQIVDIKYGTFNNWINGTREPNFDALLKIKQKHEEKFNENINLDWLISGEGEMFIKQISSDDEIMAKFKKFREQEGF